MKVGGPYPPEYGRFSGTKRPESTYQGDLLRLMNELGQEGVQQLSKLYEDTARSGQQLSDQEVAMSLFLQNATEVATVDEDRALALRLSQQLELDDDAPPTVTPPLIRTPVRPNLQPNPPRYIPPSDRPPPPRMQRVAPAAAPSKNLDTPNPLGKWFSTMFGRWFNTSEPCAAPSVEPGSRAAKMPARPTGHTCVVCQEAIHGSEIRAPCGDHYDIECITQLFQSATRDETLYPPRCCRQPIPFAQVELHLNPAVVQELREKGREFGTLKRVYCAQQTCSRFLGPLSESLFGTKVYDCPAPGCAARTCGRCRARYEGWMHTCSEDPSAEQVITLGRAEGWARCPGCAQMIELNMGCYHMTCRCRTEFCYLCRARWKTCTCPQWDEHRLLAVAERRVDARPRQPPLPVRPIIRPRQPLRPPATAPLVPRPVPALQPAAATPAPQPAAARTAAVPAVPAPVPAPQTARAGPARATATTVSAQQQQDSARQRMIRELMDHLRIDHECAHNNWSYRRGGGECENCHQHLPHYLFRCQQCEMLVCNRCRRNRL